MSIYTLVSVVLIWLAGCAVDDDKERGFVEKGPPNGATQNAAAAGVQPLPAKTLADQGAAPEGSGGESQDKTGASKSGNVVSESGDLDTKAEKSDSSSSGTECVKAGSSLGSARVLPADGVNVRSQPSSESLRVGGFTAGAEIQIWKIYGSGQDRWFCVEGTTEPENGVIGWVRSDLVVQQ